MRAVTLGLRRRRVRARSRSRGVALVETAIVLPVLLLLLGGAGQIGAITYGNVTVDTAAREAARVGSENPHTALDVLPSSPYTCTSTDTYAVCQAARQASGALDPSSLIITITAPDTVSLVPDDVMRVASCPTSLATVTGVVSNIPTGASGAVVMGSNGGSSAQVSTDTSGNYTLCLPGGGQVLTATATGSNGCTYGTSTRVSLTAGASTTASFSLPTTCTTPTPLPSSDATPNADATPAPNGTPVPGESCTYLGVNTDVYYVSVSVAYKVPIFVPFLAKFLANSPSGSSSYRQVTATVTMRIEPCTMTQGQ